jgi:hypothetical protein
MKIEKVQESKLKVSRIDYAKISMKFYTTNKSKIFNTPSYTNKQHSNKQYSKLQQNLPIVSTCKFLYLEIGLKFWHQILEM